MIHTKTNQTSSFMSTVNPSPVLMYQLPSTVKVFIGSYKIVSLKWHNVVRFKTFLSYIVWVLRKLLGAQSLSSSHSTQTLFSYCCVSAILYGWCSEVDVSHKNRRLKILYIHLVCHWNTIYHFWFNTFFSFLFIWSDILFFRRLDVSYHFSYLVVV